MWRSWTFSNDQDARGRVRRARWLHRYSSVHVEGNRICVPLDPYRIDGTLFMPPDPHALIIIVDGSGLGVGKRLDETIGQRLNARSLATLVVDLVTSEEWSHHRAMRRHPWDTDLLAGRLATLTAHAARSTAAAGLPIGYFACEAGASVGLVAAAEQPHVVGAMVAYQGVFDRDRNLPANIVLENVRAPTRFIATDNPETTAMHGRLMCSLGTRASDLVLLPPDRTAASLEVAVPLAETWFSLHLQR